MTTGWAIATATCVLCGHAAPEVRHALIRWRDGDPFGTGPRCPDRDACHSRCLANGDEWPVDDGRPRGRAAEVPASSQVLPDREPVDELDFGTAPEVAT